MENKKYKLIAMDLDGTLLTDVKRVLKETYKDLNEAHQSFYLVGLTARTITSVEKVIKLDTFDYIICNNGADFYNCKTKELRCENAIDKEKIKNLLEDYKENIVAIDCCTPHYYYKSKFYIPFISFIKKYKSIDSISEDISRINLYIKNNNIDKIENDLKSKYKDFNIYKMQDSKTTSQRLIITKSGIDKELSLSKLLKQLKLKKEEAVFFGDGLNDISTLKSVGLGVAMKNALEEVKKASNTITEKNNNNNGVGYFIRCNLLNYKNPQICGKNKKGRRK